MKEQGDEGSRRCKGKRLTAIFELKDEKGNGK
jgi:hypothetical protein